ncbi:2-phosphosulfolactate phosphatase [Microbacterium sp. SSW1-49]|uniref:Probable 2-phosphosulfolactate phosphatase n=1 Tax=Microbacterium croceum TaxID=2851645 RepID=A0ABT0FD33_9MICO|nr:2-phosphosulfolactate phosphatase [Microbacterium croceum]MCK2035839.1 2-phosphosulfolactate phosphatase [Microbacterium croceum]
MPPFDQSTYQVRLDWGLAGLERLADADVVVIVDVLHFSSRLADAVLGGAEVDLADAANWSVDAVAPALAVTAAAGGATVLVGGLRNASAVARSVQALQEQRQARTSVAVIAAGERDGSNDLRFAVEDHLGAGAIIAALTDLGIDHTAPDAAVAAEGFRALRRALGHLVSASGSARDGADAETVAAASRLDAVSTVPVLRDRVFVCFA